MRRTEDGCRWRVVPEWESILLGSGGLALETWLADGRARMIRQRAGRAIYRVQLGGRAIYVKHQRSAGLVRGLADLARGSAARREWLATVESLRRGIPTAMPVAYGEQSTAGWLRSSWFISEAIDGAEPLDQFMLGRVDSLPTSRRWVLRRQILDRMARFVAAVHEAGLRGRDLHAGNILVARDQIDGSDRGGIYLIDLAGARFSGPLKWAASRADLVVLHAEWFDRLTRAERWRFFLVYRKNRSDLRFPPRDVLVDQLDRGARAHSRRIDRRRDRRVLRDNRDFLVITRPDRRLHGSRDVSESVLEEFLRRPEAMVLETLDQPVKISHATLVVRAEWPLADGTCRPVAIKRCRPLGVVKAILDRFRRSRALRGWWLGHALQSRRIATAKPLAVCDVPRSPHPADGSWWSRWFAPRESYLAVEWIEGAENLHLWAWRLAECPWEERLRRASRCAESLGRLLGRMHARCVSHRDLKGSNLLVAEAGGETRTWLIDADSTRIHRRLTARRRADDLARLAVSVEAHPWVSRTIRYRFLREYAAWFPRGQIDQRRLWRAVARRALRLIARKKRRGKPLL